MSESREKLEAEIRKCACDFRYFAQRYLKIIDKRSRVVPFVMNDAQERFWSTVEENPWTYILKARQLGMTTAVAARNFWRVLFTPNHRVAVLAHRGDSAEAIFEVYKNFYANLPGFLKFKTEKSNVRELKLFHGGLIKVDTANSEGLRGTTYQALHCSEFAFWNDPEKTIAGAFQVLGPDAEVVLETTANGVNDAHKIWHAENGYEKLFIPWTQDPNYISKEKPKYIHPKLKELGLKHELGNGRVWWAQETLETKCAGNWHTFLQEYPLTAQMAFITSGERFFTRIYPHVQVATGYKEFKPHSKYRVYTLGADVASGAPSGDYSAFVVLDVTDKDKPVVCSSFYQRMAPHQFAEKVLEEAKKYNALVVVESNTYGLSILEYLVKKEWAFVFRRTAFDKVGNRWVDKMGFSTNVNTRPVMLSRLHEYVEMEKMAVVDPRMQFEMNTFIFNDNGKPEAQKNKHDDMIFAHALGLMGLDQIEYVREEIVQEKPRNLHEMLQFELNTGKLHPKKRDADNTDRWGMRTDVASLTESALTTRPPRR